jgi:hypothetical protein
VTSLRQERRLRCITDPIAFAVTYLPHHIRNAAGEITFAGLHTALSDLAAGWVAGPLNVPAAERDLFVAPRECGKSTWVFLVLPLWAAAYGHKRFAVAFADSGVQAETHLDTFKNELDTNKLLRQDFPELCRAKRRPTGTTVADRRGFYQSASGFTFVARGIDASTLGLKVGELRPDLILLDDIEPDESNYSAYQKDKRLRTLLDAVLPLNIYATVLGVGTVTMPGSVIHDAVRYARGGESRTTDNEWVGENGFRVHYFPAIVTTREGLEISLWPAKWPIDFLQSIRHTRQYAKNYANDPMGRDGDYWTKEDFTYVSTLQGATRHVLSVDPSVSTKTTSDPTGLSVVSFTPALTAPMDRIPAMDAGIGLRTEQKSTCTVSYAEAVRITGDPLRAHCLKLIERFPHITHVLVEINQGGDLWHGVFHDMPVKVVTVHQTEPKEVRAARTLGYYQRHRVGHLGRLAAAEEQMIGFPKAPHDDIVDSIGSAVCRFLDGRKPKRGTVTVSRYA